MPKVRRATHAGSWYPDNPKEFGPVIDKWLEDCKVEPKAKAVIVPHAGARFCGHVAAASFAGLRKDVKRVFILGPSHHVYLDSIALSQATELETPFGKLPVDRSIVTELADTAKFKIFDMGDDEEEHSLEMMMPYLGRIFSGTDVKFIPLVVGDLSPTQQDMFGEMLAKYFDDKDTAFVISSDFCHWGARFRYTWYDESKGPLHESIKYLDHQGMEAICTQDPNRFRKYLAETRNTICGRLPILVLLEILGKSKNKYSAKFISYDQSSKAVDPKRDSSVSYAAGVFMPA